MMDKESIDKIIVKTAGYFLFFGLITTAIILGNTGEDAYAFVDYPSLMIVFGCSFAVSVIAGGVFTPTKDDRERLVRWQAIAVSVIMATLTGVMTGIIQMLQYLIDPNGIGPGMAVSLLSCFAGILILVLIVLPQLDRYTKKCGTFHELSLARVACLGFPIMCIFIVVLSLMILVSSMGYVK